MSFLTGLGRVKLDGQKALTKDKPILVLEAPDTVYVPLCIGMAIQFDIHVKEGDQVCVGTKLATRKDMYVPIYSPVSGTVKGFEKRAHVSGRVINHVVIENDHENKEVKAIEVENPEALTQPEIVNCIKELGLVGLGGSGFPTYIKYGRIDAIETILINGVECEPFLTSDHLAMKRDIPALFDGVEWLMKAAEAKNAIIAIKEHKPDLFELLTAEASKHANITAVEVPDAYPMGWERTLVQQVIGKDFERLPAEVGVIVNNASTAMALSKGIREGKGIYRRVVTVSGDAIKNPQNVDVVVGTPFNTIVEALGGYADCEEGYVLHGGPMMGKSVANDQFVITEYTNGVTCLVKNDPEPLACLKCGECTLHCPAGLQPVKIIQAEKAQSLETLEKLDVMTCVGCGSCSYICPSKIEVTDWVAKGKQRVNVAIIKRNALAKKQAADAAKKAAAEAAKKASEGGKE